MWTVSSIATRSTAMDFTSSGQGRPVVTQLLFDEIVAANAIELTDWTEDSIQVEVCEACGIEHCKPGGWGTLRRLGSSVVLMPDFQAMTENLAEYHPPRWMSNPGPALVSGRLVEELWAAIPELPEVTSLKSLSGAEAARCIQWSAPLGALGEFPSSPLVQRDKICAVSTGSLAEVAAELDRLLASLRSLTEVRLSMPEGAAKVIVYLDAAGYPEWTPCVELEEKRLKLRWEPYVIE